jgi:hypothetical protein
MFYHQAFYKNVKILSGIRYLNRSQWPRRLTAGSAVTRLLGLRVLIPLGALMFSLVNVACYYVGVYKTG